MRLAKGPPRRRKPPALGVYVHFPWCLQKCPYCDFLSVAAEPAAHPAPGLRRRRHRRARAARAGARRAPARRASSSAAARRRSGSRASSGACSTRCSRLFAAKAARRGDHGRMQSVELRPRARAGADRPRASIASASAFRGSTRSACASSAACTTWTAACGAVRRRDRCRRAAGLRGLDLRRRRPVSAKRRERSARGSPSSGRRHLSAYALTIEPGTQFGALARKGQASAARRRRRRRLFRGGRSGARERRASRTTRSATTRETATSPGTTSATGAGRDYLGLGTGAWGTYTLSGRRVRYRNTPSPERYLGRPHAAGRDRSHDARSELVSEVEPIDPETALRERLMLGLRLEDGLDVDFAAQELGVPPGQPLASARWRAWWRAGAYPRWVSALDSEGGLAVRGRDDCAT